MFRTKLHSFLMMGLLLITPKLHAQDATEIVQKMYDNMQGKSSKTEMTMQIIRPKWERSVSFKSWSLGQDYSLILTTAPARDKGTAFLMRENEIWNWLPDVNRTIKMPPSMMSRSWMGSDFSNNDLVRESSVVKDYTHTLVGDTTLRGYDCYKIKMIPKPDAPIVWAKVLSYITKDKYMQLRSEFYDEDGFLVRTMDGSEIKEIGDRYIPTKMVMVPVEEEGNKTIITYQNLEFDMGISKRFFSTQNMKRVN